MGLDQYLYAKKYTSDSAIFNTIEEFDQLKEILGTDVAFLTERNPSISVEIKVGQWRKSNQIHKYFVDNCQDGRDDCREYYADREKLAELLSLCKQVLADKSKAEELLPVQEGFFFGDTEYDQWYYSDLTDTVEILENCLKMSNDWEFHYQSSW